MGTERKKRLLNLDSFLSVVKPKPSQVPSTPQLPKTGYMICIRKNRDPLIFKELDLSRLEGQELLEWLSQIHHHLDTKTLDITKPLSTGDRLKMIDFILQFNTSEFMTEKKTAPLLH